METLQNEKFKQDVGIIKNIRRKEYMNNKNIYNNVQHFH